MRELNQFLIDNNSQEIALVLTRLGVAAPNLEPISNLSDQKLIRAIQTNLEIRGSLEAFQAQEVLTILVDEYTLRTYPIKTSVRKSKI